MLCDNEDVYNNTLTPESKLNKKNVSICYHKCRKDVAAEVDRISKEGTATNLPDLLTKILVQIRRETLLYKLKY